MKLVKLIILITLATFKLSAQTFGGGIGTKDEPYLISSKAHLEELADIINTSLDTNWSVGKYFEVTQNIREAVTKKIGQFHILDGRFYRPISMFRGHFNGNNFLININIHHTRTSHTDGNMFNNYVGLFGAIKNATICNVVVTGHISSDGHVGGIIGCALDNSNIYNCTNLAKVEGVSDCNLCAAGIVAHSFGTTNISGCLNLGTIIGYAKPSENDIEDGYLFIVGGIAAYHPKSNITNCINTGFIKGNDGNYVGGILAYDFKDTRVSNCINTGVLAGETNTKIGGISPKE